MSIIKAKNKSIFIEKCHQGDEHFEADKQPVKSEKKHENNEILFSFDDKLPEKSENEE